jgi:acyl-CoA synthetase (AMP-forming)/AMP-acid ligase II
MSAAPVSILAPLRAHAERDPERLLFAYLDGAGRVTESYGRAAFLERSAGIAAHLLRTHPLPVGERVLLVYPPALN